MVPTPSDLWQHGTWSFAHTCELDPADHLLFSAAVLRLPPVYLYSECFLALGVCEKPGHIYTASSCTDAFVVSQLSVFCPYHLNLGDS